METQTEQRLYIVGKIADQVDVALAIAVDEYFANGGTMEGLRELVEVAAEEREAEAAR
jgi:hypothetical protein